MGHEQSPAFVITEPVVTYAQLSSELVRCASAPEAEKIAIGLIAERARIKGEGKILSWSEFNENPDPLVNQLLARILVSRVKKHLMEGLPASHIAVLSIENSAGYLASEVTHELAEKFRLRKPPRIIRARKSLDGLPPSPAMNEYVAHALVYPITSEGRGRHLVASMPKDSGLEQVRVVIPVDDFRATGDTLRGGTELALSLLAQAGVPPEELTVIPMAGLGKPEQERVHATDQPGAHVLDVITAVNVTFWPDEALGRVLIQANSFPPFVMRNATTADFHKEI